MVPKTALASALDRFGRVDALVNNAGVHRSAPCWEQSDDDFDAMFDVNVTAPFRFSRGSLSTGCTTSKAR